MENKQYTNQTKLNQDELVSLLATQTLPLSKMIISLASIVILTVLLILNWDNNDLALYIILTVLLSLGLIGTILLFIGKKWLIKVSNKELANGVIYDYLFNEGGFKVECTIGDKKSQQNIRFAEVEKILIKDRYAFIYANNVSIYFVDMEAFGDDKVLMENIFDKYKIKKSKRNKA